MKRYSLLYNPEANKYIVADHRLGRYSSSLSLQNICVFHRIRICKPVSSIAPSKLALVLELNDGFAFYRLPQTHPELFI